MARTTYQIDGRLVTETTDQLVAQAYTRAGHRVTAHTETDA